MRCGICNGCGCCCCFGGCYLEHAEDEASMEDGDEALVHRLAIQPRVFRFAEQLTIERKVYLREDENKHETEKEDPNE